MRAPNPVLLEGWRGLVGSAEATRAHFGYLLLQGAALLLWWPWNEMARVLESGAQPKTLLAVSIALAACAALDGVRAGAEELLLPGQHPLREWVVDTSLSLVRIVSGWLALQLLQLAYLLALSAPLLVMALPVSAASWASLGWVLATIVVVGIEFRLCGALVYLLVGHRSQATFVGLRVLVVTVFVTLPFVLPAASQPVLAHALLVGGDVSELAVAGVPAFGVHLAVHGSAVVVMLAALCGWLARERRETPMPAVVPGSSASGGGA